MTTISDAKDLAKVLTDIKSELHTLQKRSASQAEQLEAQEKMANALKEENERLKLKALDTSRIDGGGYSKYFSESGELRLHEDDVDSGPGLLDDPKNVSDWHQELKRLVDNRSILRKYCSSGRTPRTDARLKRHLKSAPYEIREKIFSDSSNIGAEWIEDNMAPLLQQEIASLRRLESVFDVLPTSGGSTLIPYLGDGIRPYLVNPPTSDNPADYTPSSVTTNQRTVVVRKFAIAVQLNTDSVEDSVIPVIEQIRSRIARAMASGFEDAIINGDDSATHQDAIATWNASGLWGSAGLGTSADHRRAFQGLRKRALLLTGMAVDQNASQTTTGARQLMNLLPGPVQSGSGIFVCNPQYAIKLLTDANLVTADKYGPNATILSGEFGSMFGKKVIISDLMTADLAASGLYTGSGATTGLIYLNTDRFKIVQKRGFNLEMEKSILKSVTYLVGSITKSFVNTHPTDGAGGEKNVSYGYNLTVS